MIKDNKKYPCCLYLHLYEKLLTGSDERHSLRIGDAKVLLARGFRVPHHLKLQVLKEMEFMGLLQFMNRDLIELKIIHH